MSSLKFWGSDEEEIEKPSELYEIESTTSIEIKWKNKVHEVLEGHKTYATLPPMEDFAIYHPKKIDRQEKQNEYYNTL